LKNYKGIRLLHKYLYGKPTSEDRAKVEKWYEQIDENNNVGYPDELLQLKEKLYQRTWDKLKPGARVIPFYKKYFFKIAAAIILTVSITSFSFLFFKRMNSTTTIVETHSPALKNDVAAPTGNKAILTLADGSTIILDSAGIGSLAKQGNAMISKLNNGKIVYNNNPNIAAKIQFNTLSVPKGSKPIQLVLADGSEVWLNVASSITYPTAFSGNERRVTITGEAYFEVVKNVAKPFRVFTSSPSGKPDGAEIQVLGTHFNVNAYNDENSLKVTLLEGSVKVGQHEGRSIYIKPGQQAEMNQQGELRLNKDIDTDEVMAWKNNWFNFNSLTVPEIMRQIEKWYNVSVKYEGKPSNKHFSGIVSRSNQVSEVLKIMEQAGIKFKIEGKNITVM
jgi:ferric-dicitrate binding protein FerR (iron transport regulator)